jgi:hypothetical protein
VVERFEEAEAEDMNPEKLAYILIGVSLIIKTFFLFTYIHTYIHV